MPTNAVQHALKSKKIYAGSIFQEIDATIL
jgi:hypothetical protein